MSTTYKKHKYNESFFEEMTNDLAYIIGFTLTDGNIYQNTLGWQVQKRDEALLMQFRDLLCPTKSLGSIEQTMPSGTIARSVSFRVNNKNIREKIEKFNLTPRKTYTARIPMTVLESKYYPDCIRGIIDGDGSISLRRNSKTLEMCSASREFMQDFMEIVDQELNIALKNINIRKKHGASAALYRVTYVSAQARKILNWAYYPGCNLKLERKRVRATSVIPPATCYWSEDDYNKIPDSYKEANYTKLAKELGRSVSSIKNAIHYKRQKRITTPLAVVKG